MSVDFVPETRFGKWFLGTQTWNVHVLQRALNDLQRLMPARAPCDTVLDVGSGFGFSLVQLAQRFSPARIIALDADPEMPQQIQPELARCAAPVELLVGDAAAIPLPDNAVDIVYCHQTFHHLVHQEAAIREFFRVLKPGGLLLFAESTKRYIYSPLIRLLFRHPMHVQKTAEEYIGLIREAGFDLPDERISLPYLWWSRPDIGMWEWFGFKVPATREETLVNAVAVKKP
ncbi:MAG TPA: methyltransferase domain-containing protein [Pseudomonadales bacterium]|nr:methyltransferase domain-containing protein [Pseudomonadales bacterium]